ncbi:MAG: hypothetical protein Q7U06_01965, partial [Pseudomonadota bacterium]|nr:hypothetical protein [Pseudomonadota bacterium]
TALAVADRTLDDAWVRILPSTEHVGYRDTFGSGFTSPGDLDADGVPDFALADANWDEWTEDDSTGRAYVFFGASLVGGTLGTDEADAIFTSDLPGQQLGYAFGGGDVDGDCVDDLVIGSTGDGALPDAGRSWVMLSPFG